MAKTRQASQKELFPILPATESGEKGIAKLAAQSPVIDTGHLVEYRNLPIRSLLSACNSKRMMFAKSINPYRGCEYGCRYCYARYTHEFMHFENLEDFERIIFIKQNAAWILRQELRSLRQGEELAIGTATDPYQPIERRAGITRSVLEVLAEKIGLNIGIVTKSTLIERDLDLLKKIASQNELTLHLTITTPDISLARILEPRAPRPDLRFQTVLKLRHAGLRTGILCSPILPEITDSYSAMDRMAETARKVKACFLYAQPLFLKSCSRPVFLQLLKDHFPQLVSSYEQRFQYKAFLSADYHRRVRSILRSVCQKHRIGYRWEVTVTDQGTKKSTDPNGTLQPWLWPECDER